ncbi:MAG: signal peptide peptidase SppA [Myxococcota bacterium]
MGRIESQARAGRCARAWLSLFLAAIVATTSGCITIDVLGGGEEAALVETVVRGREGPKILLLDIDGVIGEADLAGSFFGGPMLGTAARVAEVLDRARRDDEVAAVLLRIDSPGGTATESEQVYEEILRFREARRVPVVAQFLGTATSGAYYVAMAADQIQAHPTTVTGSIGVIFTSLSFAGLMEKLGIEDQTITGGEFKDAGSPFRRLSPVERAQLQTVVDDLHARFREIVQRGRPKLTAEQVAALASGRIFSAREALEAGLVDSIGNLDESVRALERRLGGKPARVVTYHRPREIRRNLYTRSGAVPRIDGSAALGSETAELLALQRLDRLFGRPGFHYVWWPGVGASGLGSGSGVGARLSGD